MRYLTVSKKQILDYTLPEYVNLAAESDIDQDKLELLGQMCFEQFVADKDSRADWEEMVAEWIKLFFMKDKPKNPPWEGSSTESIPMLLEACNQSHARSYNAMFPGRLIVSAVATGVSTNPAVRSRMDRVSKHMSYQLQTENKSYITDKDRLLLSIPLYGSMFTKTYYDPLLKKNCVSTIRPMDLVVPYGIGPRNIEDIPRKTEIIMLPKHKATYLFRRGYFNHMPKVCEYGENKTKVDDVVEDIEGISPPANINDNCYILEQHRFLDLDGDGLEEPYIVTLDGVTGKILRISIRYVVDEQGLPTDYKAPIESYTDYHFIPNPNGFYGLGYGMLLAPINVAINKLLRQTIDAGTLQNVGNMSGFVDDKLNIPTKLIQMVMGKFTRVNSSADDINKSIFQFKFPGPSSVLAEVLRMLTLRGDRLAMVTETITGQAERVMQPTTVLALIEQAQVIFTAVQSRTILSWSRELEKLYHLNYKYGIPYQQFMFATSGGDPEMIMISKEDYAPDMTVIPLADPKMSTKREKLALSDAEFQTGQACPFTMSSPLHMYQLFRRRFEAIGTNNIDEIMPPIPVDPLTGMPIMPTLPGVNAEDDSESNDKDSEGGESKGASNDPSNGAQPGGAVAQPGKQGGMML